VAPPFRWTDDLAKLGWLAVLSGAEVRVLWGVGAFYHLKTAQAKIDALIFQNLTGLSPSGFYEARGRLLKFGLIQIALGTRLGRYRQYRTHVYHLVNPVPPVPFDYESAGTDSYSQEKNAIRPLRRRVLTARVEGTVRPSRHADGANPCGSGLSGSESTTAKTQLGQALETATSSKALEAAISRRLPGVGAEVVQLVSAWAGTLRRSPTSYEKVIQEGVGAICRRFPTLATADVRLAVEDGATALHPMVQQAVAIFDATVVEVARTSA
jgi:hypothetical protein